MENGEKDWMKWIIRSVFILLWGVAITVLTSFNSRICANESRQSETHAEVASMQRDILYIKESSDETKKDLKEIASLIRSIR